MPQNKRDVIISDVELLGTNGIQTIFVVECLDCGAIGARYLLGPAEALQDEHIAFHREEDRKDQERELVQNMIKSLWDALYGVVEDGDMDEDQLEAFNSVTAILASLVRDEEEYLDMRPRAVQAVRMFLDQVREPAPVLPEEG